ncbi:MAG: phosphoenolpyruvate synthase, partial [bacterium]|nr:phosphoenolpyruvate synthase [bacterium]
KIHSQPDGGDRDSVRSFIARTQMGPTVSALMTDLEAQLTRMYEIPSAEILAGLSTGMNVDSLSRSLGEAERKQEFDAICRIGADILLYLREGAPECDPAKRLQLMDLSLAVEGSIFRAMGGWKVRTPEAMMAKARVLIQAAAGCGYLELWEFQRLSALIETPTGTEPLATFAEKVTRVGRVVNWGAGSVRAIYEPTVAVFAPFEPLASGFVDDRVRGSLLLGVGDVARQLAESLAYLSGNGNQIMGLRLGKGARGLNPGFARGELVVIKGAAGEVDFDGRKIYVVQQAPAEMKPVAGIATVSEGNAVSHVQLLARNLGIPNAVMTADLVTDLGPFSGKDVFYAVSPGGVVVMKLASDMTDDEKALFDTRRVLDERIAVPTDRMNLSDVDLPSLMEVRAVDSGVICGPKAANLGELRSLFPAQVAPGMVIPFAVFRAHMDQKMPDQTQTYWGFLQETFSRINRQSDLRSIDPAVEAEVLVRLSHLRESIKKMPLLPWFSDGLSKQFFSVFGDSLGGVAVFVRSDTNMEDLKDFTGAGLNLTVPNTKDRDILLQAIRDVWSSPFTERSYRWRQKFLRNPEQIYPSILLLKSVPVEKSGVMITSGVGGGDPEDVTVAFSRGVGGAVEGQAAETYLLKASGHDILLAPAREARFSVLPQTGGLARVATSFEKPVLDESDRLALRLMAKEIRDKLSGMSEPFDVELGILNGKVYLFQIRPFVESKRARASVYLNGLDPDIPGDATVDLTARIRVGE